MKNPSPISFALLNGPASRARRQSLRLASAALLLGLVSVNCAVVQSVRDPVTKLLRRGACISVDIPPITLTPERTAAERQLIGTEGEIEEDGWLIASAQSASATPELRDNSAGESVSAQFRSQNRRYRIESEVIDFYYPLVLKYRRAELLGEGYDGRLRVVPGNLSRARFSEESDTAAEVAREVNRARLWIFDFLRRESQNADASSEDRAASQRASAGYLTRWFSEARSRSGEWIYTDRRRWERAR